MPHLRVIGQQCTPAASASDFEMCVMNGATTISIANGSMFTVNLAGKSLAGKTIDLNNGDLIINGNPTVNSGTTFTGGGSGSLRLNGTTNFIIFTLNGANDYAELNTAMDQPANTDLHKAAISVSGGNASPLPVTFSKFTGLTQVDEVKLSWQTSTELNNAKFIIETSHQGETFQRIGEVAGAGTTTEPQNYSFTHHTPSTGINYYRLKQVDFDGTFEYSKVIAIDAPGSHDVFAFPNPAREKISVQYDQSKGAGNIQLLDALGRRIQANIVGYAGNYEVTLPESLARGTYWLKVERGGKVQTLPVVKE